MYQNIEKVLKEMGNSSDNIPEIMKAIPNQVRDILDSLSSEELHELIATLCYIYIAQNIRDKGVLRSKCKNENSLSLLYQLGFIEEEKWCSINVVRTSPSGTNISNKILEIKIKEIQPNEFIKFSPLAKIILLNGITNKFLFLPTEFFNKDCFDSFFIAGESIESFINRLPYCSDPVFSECKLLADELVRRGMGAIADYYVCSHGGRVDEKLYVFSEKIIDVLKVDMEDAYRISKNIESFGKEMETKYKAIKFLQQYDSQKYEGIGEYRNSSISIIDYLTRLENCVFVTKDVTTTGFGREMPFIIKDPKHYKAGLQQFKVDLINEIEKELERLKELKHEPVKIETKGLKEQKSNDKKDTKTSEKPEKKLEKKEFKPDEIKVLPPLFPFKITFPRYDDGKAIVFGRGRLKNKIAWGFEAGKPLSVETLVTSDLYDINQPHVGSFQQIRTGKSTLASCVMLQVAFQGVPVVVFDPKPDYVSSLIPVSHTIGIFPEYKEPIEKRFKEASQDIRGFDFTKKVEFEQEGKRRNVLFQIYSFEKDLEGLPNYRSLKLPLLVLPPLDDKDFDDQCNAAATSLVNCLHLSRGKASNTLLADAMKKFKRDNPEREFMLKKDVEQKLELYSEEADKEGKKRVDNLKNALDDFCTANSYLYAEKETDVVKMDFIIRNPEFEDGDNQTVTISVIDISALPQEKHNPVMLNYVSQVCGQLYNFVKRKRSDKPVQLFIIFDEAQNYLPEPSDTYNYARVVINRGASLGMKAWLIAQSPQAVAKEARKQFTALVLSKVNEASVRDEVSKYVQNESWTDKLKQTGLGKALIINSETGAEGGKLCVVFTTPQTVNILSPKQIAKALSQG